MTFLRRIPLPKQFEYILTEDMIYYFKPNLYQSATYIVASCFARVRRHSIETGCRTVKTEIIVQGIANE